MASSPSFGDVDRILSAVTLLPHFRIDPRDLIDKLFGSDFRIGSDKVLYLEDDSGVLEACNGLQTSGDYRSWVAQSFW
jgi:hypothetical protein